MGNLLSYISTFYHKKLDTCIFECLSWYFASDSSNTDFNPNLFFYFKLKFTDSGLLGCIHSICTLIPWKSCLDIIF